MTRDEIRKLAGDLVQGTLSDDDHRRLEEAIAADPEARRAYLEVVDLHLALREIHLGKEAAAPLHAMKRDLDRITPSRRPVALFYGLAAAVLLSAVLFFVRFRDPSPHATVVQSAGARFYAGVTLRVGDVVPPDREVALVEGLLEVRFSSGAEAILQGPAVFVVSGPEHLKVNYGSCSVHASEGFVVETPVTRVTDRGTRFSVSVDESGAADVQVTEGEAEVGSRRLTEGDARRYGPGTEEAVPFDRSRYPGGLPDRVVRYTATTRAGKGGAEDLTGVTLRRGGEEVTYPVEDLIGIRVIHFKGIRGPGNYVSTVTGREPERPRHALLDGDRNLNTGVINPGGSPTPLTTDPVMNDPEDPRRPNTPGLAFRFLRPVRNGPGPDVVMFEFQPVIQPEYGDPFHVSPLRFEPGLKSHTIRRWDLGTFSPEALTIAGFRLDAFGGPVSTTTQLEEHPIRGGVDYPVTSKALAVGIDLSDLGYPEGAEVDGLFLQDMLDQGHRIDPVYIGGLP